MKYPRTGHLPESPGATRDDRRLADLSSFVGRRLVATEKADGSNVCLEREGCFARSHGHAPAHPSFDGLKALHARVRALINPGLQVFGEWLYARHSIGYSALPSYFLVIRVHDAGAGRWLSWEESERWADVLGLPTVPVLAQLTASDGAASGSSSAQLALALAGRRSERTKDSPLGKPWGRGETLESWWTNPDELSERIRLPRFCRPLSTTMAAPSSV